MTKMTSPGRPTRVLVSYAHERSIREHRDRALKLAQSLRLRGVEAMIDQFIEHDPPVPSWTRWMTDHVRDADFVLCLASSEYKQRVESRSEPSTGRGARWEGAIITEELYSGFPYAFSKFVAVVLEEMSPEVIQDILLPVGRSYHLWPRDDENLYRRITRQPRVLPAPLGSIILLPSATAYSVFDVAPRGALRVQAITPNWLRPASVPKMPSY
jgi:hypothetical protein